MGNYFVTGVEIVISAALKNPGRKHMWINMDQIPGSVKMNRNKVLCRNVIQMGEKTKIRELFSTLAATKVWRLLMSVGQC